MTHKKIIYTLLLVIAVMFLLFGARYFLAKKEVFLPPTIKTTDKKASGAAANVLTSVILGTEKDIYAVNEDITALILVKNEFDSAKDWEIAAGIKEKSAGLDSSFILKQEKSIRLSPKETTREELVFNPKGSELTPGEYRLELSVLESEQEISLKTVIFKIQ